VQPERHARRRRTVSGHIYIKDRAKGSIWYWRVRLPFGGEERKAIGPAWTGRGRTPDGYFTRRSAQAALDARLTDLRRGVGIPIRSRATFRDAAERWYSERSHRENWKPSTRRDYRSALDTHLLPAFGDLPIEQVTARAIERWRKSKTDKKTASGEDEKPMSRRTAAKLVAILHGIFEEGRSAYGLTTNPAHDVARWKLDYRASALEFPFYEPEQVYALSRAAANDQDAAIFITAAFSGLRLGELLGLRMRDIDFPGATIRVLRSIDIREGVIVPKSGKGRSVPLAPPVATVLAKLLQRERFAGPDDYIFVGGDGRYLDGSALRRRYRDAQTTAKLPPIRFHDLRHTFATLIASDPETSERELQAWLGHADLRTMERYRHYRPQKTAAERIGRIFVPDQAETISDAARLNGDD
jgi:integrase